MEREYDVIIIGAGAVGCAVARELSRYDMRIAVLEKNSDVAGETSGRNSAVVHAGFNNRPGSRMASLCVEGNEGFEALCRDLDVPFRQSGKLVVGLDEEDEKTLEHLLRQGRANGCRDLEILEGEELKRLLRKHGIREPQGEGSSRKGWRKALWSPHTGITNPFLYCVALAENAQANGVRFFLRTEVAGIRYCPDSVREAASGGAGSAKTTSGGAPSGAGGMRFEISAAASSEGGGRQQVGLRCRYLINCAGLHADRIAAMAGVDQYQIWPCRGEYFILDRQETAMEAEREQPGRCAPGESDASGASGEPGSEQARNLPDGLPMPIYPAPKKRAGGLGVHLTPTIEGNVIIGPSAEYLDQETRDDYACTRPVMKELMDQAAQLMPEVAAMQPIGNYSGIRPKLTPPGEGGYHDFVIRAEDSVPGLIDLMGIESPGLTASVPIGREVCRLLEEMAGCDDGEDDMASEGRPCRLRLKPDFCGRRKGILRFREQPPQKQAELIRQDPDYGEIICRCQKITKREIREAIENPLGAVSISAIKYRAWATTGRCNGGYCLPRIVQLLLEEYGMEEDQICYRDPGSEMFSGRVK